MKSMAALAGTGLLLLGWALATRQPPSIEVSNHSGLAITDVRICVGDATVAASAMRNGDVDRFSVPVRREGPVLIQLKLSDGTTQTLPAGWFSPGQSDLAEITIVSADSLRRSR